MDPVVSGRWMVSWGQAQCCSDARPGGAAELPLSTSAQHDSTCPLILDAPGCHLHSPPRPAVPVLLHASPMVSPQQTQPPAWSLHHRPAGHPRFQPGGVLSKCGAQSGGRCPCSGGWRGLPPSQML